MSPERLLQTSFRKAKYGFTIHGGLSDPLSKRRKQLEIEDAVTGQLAGILSVRFGYLAEFLLPGAHRHSIYLDCLLVSRGKK